MHLTLDDAALRELVKKALADVIGALDWPSGRIAVSESQAAEMLSVNRHQLRDARLRGELVGRKVGKRTIYTRADLVAYLDRNGSNGNGGSRRRSEQ